jgi:hypothetical protein
MTWKGKFFQVVGALMSVIGTYKFAMAIINTMLRREPTKDTVTSLFEVCHTS